MVDDYSKALALTERMKKLLPFPVYPSKILVKMLEDKGSKLKFNQGIQVIDLLYSGDEGGILCCLESQPEQKEALVISLTHLVIPDENPLAQEIRAYQKKRNIGLAMQEVRFGQAKRLAKKTRKKRGFGE
jgi:hypothetical protein